MRVAARSLAAALGWRLAAAEVCLPRCACNDRAVQIAASTLCFIALVPGRADVVVFVRSRYFFLCQPV